MRNLPLGRLVDSPDAICDKSKAKVASNDTNFLGSQAWHVVHIEKEIGKQGVQVSEVTNLASTQSKEML